MPEAVMEATYCAQQILIPPSFPHILKVFAKAAIRTQPYDLLTWAAAYFKALADGTLPPVKERLEYPLVRSKGGLSYGYLQLLVKQFDTPESIEQKILTKRWLGICLTLEELDEIYCTAGLYKSHSFPLFKFIAVAAGFLTNNLTQTMVLLCEIYTDEPDGANASIPASFFMDMYRFLAKIDASEEIAYYDGLTKAEYDAKIRRDSTVEMETKEEPCLERWVPKMRGWKTEVEVLKRNILLDEDLPTEGGTISQNILLSVLPPRERFADPNHPQFPCIPPEDLKCPSLEPSVHPIQKETGEVNEEGSQAEEKIADEGGEEGSSENVEGENADQRETVSPEREPEQNEEEPEQNGEEPEQPTEEAEQPPDDGEEGEPKDDEEPKEETGAEEAGESELETEGSKVLVRVYSEEGKKIRSTSVAVPVEEENEDISVREREAIIEQLEINKEKKVNEFMEAIESLDDLVEKTKKLKSEADKIGSKGELVMCTSSIMGTTSKLIAASTEAVKQTSSSESDASRVDKRHLPDVVVVPAKPGVGPLIDPDAVEEVRKYVEETSSYQQGMIMPRDIVHCLAPSLEVKSTKPPKVCRCMTDGCQCDTFLDPGSNTDQNQ